MKKALLLLAVMICLTSLMGGCDGVVDSYNERMQRARHIDDIQTRMLVDDWDYLWLSERNSRLSEWNPRFGH